MFLNWTWVFGRRRPHFSPLTICSTVHSRLCELKIIGFIKKFFSANLKVQRDTRGTRRGNGSWPRHIFDLKNLGDKSVIDDSFGVKGELMYQRINKEKLSSSGSLRKWFSFSPDERQIHGACSSTENYLSIYIYYIHTHIYLSNWQLMTALSLWCCVLQSVISSRPDHGTCFHKLSLSSALLTKDITGGSGRYFFSFFFWTAGESNSCWQLWVHGCEHQ